MKDLNKTIFNSKSLKYWRIGKLFNLPVSMEFIRKMSLFWISMNQMRFI